MSGKCVIFGGTGFIGSHFAEYLIHNELVDEVYLADIRHISPLFSFDQNRIHYVELDVRKPIDAHALPRDITLVANFAAVHREPGHEDSEYYETNLYGAENVCAWTETIGCKLLILTSSIACYGPSEITKDESSLPVPVSAYGGSKLAAEKMHLCWQNGDPENRHLVIVRPGVVFGPGERGNVSRLIKAVLHRYFIYTGNRDTRKAGVYVKELCNAIWWVMQHQDATGEHVSLFNMTMNPGPTIQDYVDTVCKVAVVKRWFPSLPYRVLWVTACVIDVIARPLGINHPFGPVRIRKLVRSNNILPGYLVKYGYPYRYTLETAFIDWKQSCPEEWS
jgi:nucleoside-diphosphate-sugar epimerase